MSDRVRQPDQASVLGRPASDPIDSVAQLAARNELQDFALQARTGIVAAGAVARPAPSSLSGNLIVDADFEGATVNPGWTPIGSGALSISTLQAKNGLQSLLYTGSGPGGAFYGWDPVNSVATLPCTSGDAVYGECWVMQGDANGPGSFSVSFTFYNDAGTVIQDTSGSYDEFVVGDGWNFINYAWPVPPLATRFRMAISWSVASNPSTLFIDSALLALVNSFQGPLVTTPGDTGQRIKVASNEIHGFTGHHLENLEAAVTFGIKQGGNNGATKDRGLIIVRSPNLSGGVGGGTAAQLELIGGAPDGSATPLFKVDQAMEVVGQLLVDSGGIDVTGAAILRGALNLIGGLNSSSFFLDVYQPADVNPILTAAGNTADCGVAHTVTTITDRKVAILALHFVTAATVNNTATSIQHVQSGLLWSVDGSAPTVAQTFSLPTSVIGTSSDRVMAVSGVVSFGTTPTGAIKVKPQLQWSTTVVVGAGGVANLRTFSSTTVTLVVGVG